jgi:hypothetical protein
VTDGCIGLKLRITPAPCAMPTEPGVGPPPAVPHRDVEKSSNREVLEDAEAMLYRSGRRRRDAVDVPPSSAARDERRVSVSQGGE